ncbi:MAG TPA: hypothetical protein VJL82_09790 [Rhizomicrobium sp.]|nr:hypothetical protein [Rhizomicrobium sp.]
MSVPLTGILLIPLGLLLAAMPWRYALAGLMVFAMLSPAAVVNAGNFGLQPGYFLALLLIGRTIVQIMTDRFTLNRIVLSKMLPLFWFLALCFMVLFIALCFFQGSVETLSGSSGFKSGMIRPFQLARENFTQLFYLIVNICLVYALAHGGLRHEPEKLPQVWDRAIVCGLVFSVLVCLWQFASLYGALPFPSDFFYSNAGYGRADSQSMVGLFRINGSFEEPSTLGYTFTGYLLYAWGRYGLRPTGANLAMIAASVFCLLVSTSTTAFLGLFLFFCVAAFDVMTGRARLFPGKGQLTSGYLLAIALIVAAGLAFLAVLAANWAAIEIILRNTLFNKIGSTSFQQRSFADSLALQIFAQTGGIGVGLGSHKANSLLLTLLSNLGIVGVVLFGAFVLGVLKWKAPASPHGRPGEFSVRPFQLGLSGFLAIHLFSNPNLSVLTLWLAIGSMLGLQAWAARYQAPKAAGRQREFARAGSEPERPLHAPT